jgi:hypothetical protein
MFANPFDGERFSRVMPQGAPAIAPALLPTAPTAHKKQRAPDERPSKNRDAPKLAQLKP